MEKILLAIQRVKEDIHALEDEVTKYNPGLNKKRTPLHTLAADAGDIAYGAAKIRVDLSRKEL